MRFNAKHLSLIILVVLTSVVTRLSFNIAAANEDNDRWREERDQRDDLITRERELLRKADDLSADIFELKRTINALYQRLSAKQTQYQSVNHELISVQMKLLR